MFRSRNPPGGPTESTLSLRAQLAELDQEMDGLEARLRLLASERRRIMEGLNSIIYPVLTLPAEITAHIFSHYVDKPTIGPPRSPNHGPLLLASVCRTWRHTCLSVGSLWASLRVYPSYYPTKEDLDDLLSLLRCWLSRAGCYPLDLHVYASTHTLQIVSIISRYAPQWQTLGLTLHKPLAFPNAEIQGHIPNLTNLRVNFAFAVQEAPVTMSAFSDAPSLREVQLWGASLQLISLPWAQLTHLEFSDETLFACVEILQHAPNLEVLTASFAFNPLSQNNPSLAPICLPNLHTLKFIYDPDGGLLDHLTLPALKTLELKALHSDNTSRLLNLGLRSAWSLRRIQMWGMSPWSSVLCLQSIPSLESVEIRITEWPDYDWEPLCDRIIHDPEFLPALRTLILGGVAADTPAASLVGIVASRWNGNHDKVATLESFGLCFEKEAGYGDAVEEVRANLHPFAIEGLKVVVG